MMEKVIFLIPARKNSKGFKFKNRKLIDFTINSIPMEYRNQVYISTDDDVIKVRVKESNINVILSVYLANFKKWFCEKAVPQIATEFKILFLLIDIWSK